MKPLNLPPIELRTRKEGEITKVFDPLRKIWVTLTPEERVRQYFTSWLKIHLGYPPSLMANEIGITQNGRKRRCDTVVFSSTGAPLIIVEYKAPEINVTQEVFDQIVRYNICLKAKYLIVSNGLKHYCCKIDYNSGSYSFIPKIPSYSELINPISEN